MAIFVNTLVVHKPVFNESFHHLYENSKLNTGCMSEPPFLFDD